MKTSTNKKTVFLSYPLIINLIFLFITLSSCHEQEKPSRPLQKVKTISVEPRTIPATFEYVGIVQSSHLVEIRARVEGFLDVIAYKEGDLIHENDLLFQLDPKPFQAALAQAKGLQEQQEARLWNAIQAKERLVPLYAQKAASRKDLDDAIAEVLGSQASVDAAKAAVVQAELNLSYTTIRSPIMGMSNQSKYRQGALVGPGSDSTSQLTTISAFDPIWVNFNVSEADILKFQVEKAKGRLVFPKDMNFEIEIVLADGSIFPGKGKVDFADPSLQQNTGAMNVRSVLPNPENQLRPGQFVRARVLGAKYLNALVVPQKAVMQGNKGLFVYLVNKENKVELCIVEPGDWYKEEWIIKAGLKAGDQVIVEGINKVLPGMTVNVDNTNRPSS